MKKLSIILVVFIGLVLTGCVQNTAQGYYWGNYSNTQYAYKKAPGPETLSAHIATLQKIITLSKKYNLRVPPGVNAELAMMLRLQDANANVIVYLNKEVEIYPESAKFIEFVKKTLITTNEEGKNE